MIRATLALVATALGLVLLFGYRIPTPAVADRTVPQDPGDVAGAQACDPENETEQQVTGPAELWDYGVVQIRATLRGCELVDVEKVQLEATNPVSRQRSEGAEETLRTEALAQQCGELDAVSGATFTSAAYGRSLQAALDAVGAGECR